MRKAITGLMRKNLINWLDENMHLDTGLWLSREILKDYGGKLMEKFCSASLA